MYIYIFVVITPVKEGFFMEVTDADEDTPLLLAYPIRVPRS